MIGHAELSGEDPPEYRWLLTRRWQPRLGDKDGYVLWIGLNPSTADAHADDATIRRMRGFCELWGYAGFAVANLFALRASKPKVLYQSLDPHGVGGQDGSRPDVGLQRLVSAARGAAMIVVCWGVHGRRCSDWPNGGRSIEKYPHNWSLSGRASQVGQALEREGLSVVCLGTSRDGHPFHPLMRPYTDELRPFDILRRYPPERELELFCACGHSWEDHAPDPAADADGRRWAKAAGAKTYSLYPDQLGACSGELNPQVPWSRDERYGKLRCRCKQFELPTPEDYVGGPEPGKGGELIMFPGASA